MIVNKMMLCAIIGMMGALGADAISQTHSTDAEMRGNVITIRQRPGESSDAPRSSSYCPFVAEQEDAYVLLNCLNTLGFIDVILYSTAGDYYSTVFDSMDGYILIPISGEEGHYILTITTSGGQIFEGEFDI